MNADARVMEFFRSCLSRAESDAMVGHIQAHFNKHGFGLWAIAVPGVAPFIGFAGLSVPTFSAHFTPCVEVGWRLRLSIGVWLYSGGARLALSYAFRALASRSYPTSVKHRPRAVMERLGMHRNRRMI
jgi:RimJ/RimL family protein N-acetyltransferase